MNDATISALSTLRNLPPTRWLIRVLHVLGLRGRNAVIALPYIWLMLFFVIPFVIVLKISFAEIQTSSPPYTSLIHWVGDKITDLRIHLNPANYLGIWADGIY
jgi:putrescine transport system permease protein